MKDLDKLVGMYIPEDFVWRNRDGQLFAVKDMKTKHLFHTLRLIWNHLAPVTMKIHPFSNYKYPSYYTDDYLAKAVRVMFHELSNREINDYQMNQLQRIAERAVDLKEYYMLKTPSE